MFLISFPWLIFFKTKRQIITLALILFALFMAGCEQPADEGLIAFCANYYQEGEAEATAKIFTVTIDAEGSIIVPIAELSASEGTVVFSPDRTYLAYASNGNLSIMNLGNERKKVLTATDPHLQIMIGWSHDGNQLIIPYGSKTVSVMGTTVPLPDWKIVSITGNKEQIVETLPDNFFPRENFDEDTILSDLRGIIKLDGDYRLISLSPEGTQMLFWVKELDPQIAAMPDSTDSTQFDWKEFAKNFPHSSMGTLFVANIDGTGLIQLTARGEVEPDVTPRWSPDGTRIIYGSWWEDTDGDGIADLQRTRTALIVIGKDKSNPRNLLDDMYDVTCVDW